MITNGQAHAYVRVQRHSHMLIYLIQITLVVQIVQITQVTFKGARVPAATLEILPFKGARVPQPSKYCPFRWKYV